MTWSVSMSGHADNKEDEAKVIDALKTALETEGVNVGSAHMYTEHHGPIDLKPQPEPPTSVL